MAVSLQSNAYYVPLFRPDDVRQVATIGRWHGVVAGAGDGSGGNIVAMVNLVGALAFYGPHSLFNLEYLNLYITASAAPAYGAITVYWNEPTSGAAYQQITYSVSSNYGTMPSEMRKPLGDMKWRVGQTPGLTDCVYYTVANAATITGIYLYTGGFVFDERYVMK